MMKYVIVALLVILTGIFLNYPPPDLGPRLKKWLNKGKFFNYKGNKIFYIDEPGNVKDGDVLVCLHGFPSLSYDWIKIWPTLEEQFGRVIALDFIGFGFSDKPYDHHYSLMEQADIVEELVKSFSIAQVHILAHDYGDTVAQELLSRHEDRLESGEMGMKIKSACLLNGGIFPDTHFPRLIQKALLNPYIGPIVARVSSFYTFKRSFSEVFGPDTQPTADDFNDFWAALRHDDGNLIFHKLIQYIPERRANKERWTAIFKRTKVPVKVIFGPADPVNPPGFIDIYKSRAQNPNIDVLGDKIGHYPQWEDPDNVSKLYLTFVKTVLKNEQ